MHDKYVIADDSLYILGGRNTFGYFLGDYAGHKNYDRDVLVYNTGSKDSSIYQIKDYYKKITSQKCCSVFHYNESLGEKNSVKKAEQELKNRYESLENKYDKFLAENYDYKANTYETNKINLLSNPTSLYAKQPTVYYGLMYGAAKMGMHFVCLGPKSLHIDPEVLAYCKEEAKKSGGTIEVTDNVDEAVKDADVIYTDIWVSMGEDENLYKPRVEMLSPYKVTQEMMSKTGKDSTLFMHCLPSFHDFETTVAKTKHDEGIDIREVEDEVFRSKNSVVFDEAENRMHTIKAVMVATIRRDA